MSGPSGEVRDGHGVPCAPLGLEGVEVGDGALCNRPHPVLGEKGLVARYDDMGSGEQAHEHVGVEDLGGPVAEEQIAFFLVDVQLRAAKAP